MGVRLIYKDSDTARLRGNNYQATVDAGDNTLHVSVSEAEIMDYRLLPLISHLAPSGSIFSPPGKIETMTVAEHSQGFLSSSASPALDQTGKQPSLYWSSARNTSPLARSMSPGPAHCDWMISFTDRRWMRAA